MNTASYSASSLSFPGMSTVRRTKSGILYISFQSSFERTKTLISSNAFYNLFPLIKKYLRRESLTHLI